MSAFIQQADYYTSIRQENLEAAIEDDPTILDEAENEAVQMVKTYLYQRYDTETIFNETGTARHALLLKMCRKIVLYEIYQRLPYTKIPEHRMLDMEHTISLLERISEGKVALDAPRRTEEDNETIKTVRGFRSQPSRSH